MDDVIGDVIDSDFVLECDCAAAYCFRRQRCDEANLSWPRCTGAPRPSTERYGPSMRERLFEVGGFDAISGVDHLLITHLHFDHTVSISSAWLSGWLFGRRVPLKIQGPAGLKRMMEHHRCLSVGR